MTARALVIAIEEYPQAIGLARMLEGTNDAADAFITWLEQTRKVPLEHIHFCGAPGRRHRSAGTTREEILGEVQRMVEQGRDQTEELFVFFSGHGFAFAESPERKPADVIITSEFTRAEDSGGACIQLREFQEKLQLALGPGDHYYFVDVCRNFLSEEEIEPLRLGRRLGRSPLGIGSSFTLYSTGPQSVAHTDSSFSQHLIQGLHGRGRAKGWVKDRMYVTFPLLHRYVRSKLLRQEADLRIEGSSEGHLLEIHPIPRSKCRIRIHNASEQDSFTACSMLQNRFTREVTRFQGPEAELELLPGDYRLEIYHRGVVLSPLLGEGCAHWVDAYEEACTLEFENRPYVRSNVAYSIPPERTPDPLPEALRSLELVSDRVPAEQRTPSLALTLLGAGRIVYPDDLPHSVHRLPLHDFSNVGLGESSLYVLAYFTRHVPWIRIAAGSSRQVSWQEMKRVPEVEGLWEGFIPAASGPSIFSVWVASAHEEKRTSPLSYVTHLLPNRATLITLTEQEGVELELHQYFLPIHSLFHELKPDLLRRLEGTTSPSFSQALWEVQHAFARKQRLKTSLSQQSLRYLEGALHAEYLDPLMALLGLYESQRHEWEYRLGSSQYGRLVQLLGHFFAGIPDIELFPNMWMPEFLLEQTRTLPLILDRLLSWDFQEAALTLSASKLTYEGPWVSWRGAVSTSDTPDEE